MHDEQRADDEEPERASHGSSSLALVRPRRPRRGLTTARGERAGGRANSCEVSGACGRRVGLDAGGIGTPLVLWHASYRLPARRGAWAVPLVAERVLQFHEQLVRRESPAAAVDGRAGDVPGHELARHVVVVDDEQVA